MVTLILALMPAPASLAPHAWHYFAIFAGVVVALILQPLANAAVGLMGVTAATLLAPWVLFPASERTRAGFDVASQAIDWATSGFRSPAVWLVLVAFLIGRGYEHTGLGRRLALWLVARWGGRTLRLGYALTVLETVLAPCMPSNTARGAGVVYPIVRQLPAIYHSRPHDPSSRRIGAYLIWIAFAANCVTSTLFMTASSPNLLAVDIAHRLAGIEIDWMRWFLAAAPFGLPMLLALPLLVWWLYPPTLRASPAIQRWAQRERRRSPQLARQGWMMLGLTLGALVLWITASAFVHPAAVAFLVVAAMIATGILRWEQVVGDAQAWDAFLRIGTLVTLADGLGRSGFIDGFVRAASGPLAGFDPVVAACTLALLYFVSHYLFATTTAHAASVLPVVLAAAAAIPGLPLEGFALLLALEHGIMGVLTPYATGPAPVYQASGFVGNAAFWALGAVFGLIFIGALLLLAGPWLLTAR